MDKKIILSINNKKISYDSFFCNKGLIIYKIIQQNNQKLSMHYDYKLHMLVVLASIWLSKDKIKNFVKDNYDYKSPIVLTNDNDTNKILFLGDLIETSLVYANQTSFTFANNKLILYIQNKDEVKKLLINFYKKYAQLLLPEMLKEKLIKLNLQGYFGKVWFSCGRISMTYANCEFSTKKINFNAFIMQYSKQYIHSIIYHEIAHLTYPHHKKEFWNLLQSYCANYEKIPLFNCGWQIGHDNLLK